MAFDLAAFEREALKLIETGGYLEAVTQLERLGALIDEIVRKLRKKLPRDQRPREKQKADATTDHPMRPKPKKRASSAGLARLTAPKKKDQPEQQQQESGKTSPRRRLVGLSGRPSVHGSFIPTDGEEDAVAPAPAPAPGTQQLQYRITHLEARAKKAEALLEAKEEALSALEVERQRLSRSVDAKDKSLTQLKGVMRGIRKEKEQKQEAEDRERALTSNSDKTVQLEAGAPRTPAAAQPLYPAVAPPPTAPLKAPPRAACCRRAAEARGDRVAAGDRDREVAGQVQDAGLQAAAAEGAGEEGEGGGEGGRGGRPRRLPPRQRCRHRRAQPYHPQPQVPAPRL